MSVEVYISKDGNDLRADVEDLDDLSFSFSINDPTALWSPYYSGAKSLTLLGGPNTNLALDYIYRLDRYREQFLWYGAEDAYIRVKEAEILRGVIELQTVKYGDKLVRFEVDFTGGGYYLDQLLQGTEWADVPLDDHALTDATTLASRDAVNNPWNSIGVVYAFLYRPQIYTSNYHSGSSVQYVHILATRPSPYFRWLAESVYAHLGFSLDVSEINPDKLNRLCLLHSGGMKFGITTEQEEDWTQARNCIEQKLDTVLTLSWDVDEKDEYWQDTYWTQPGDAYMDFSVYIPDGAISNNPPIAPDVLTYTKQHIWTLRINDVEVSTVTYSGAAIVLHWNGWVSEFDTVKVVLRDDPAIPTPVLRVHLADAALSIDTRAVSGYDLSDTVDMSDVMSTYSLGVRDTLDAGYKMLGLLPVVEGRTVRLVSLKSSEFFSGEADLEEVDMSDVEIRALSDQCPNHKAVYAQDLLQVVAAEASSTYPGEEFSSCSNDLELPISPCKMIGWQPIGGLVHGSSVSYSPTGTNILNLSGTPYAWVQWSGTTWTVAESQTLTIRLEIDSGLTSNSHRWAIVVNGVNVVEEEYSALNGLSIRYEAYLEQGSQIFFQILASVLFPNPTPGITIANNQATASVNSPDSVKQVAYSVRFIQPDLTDRSPALAALYGGELTDAGVGTSQVFRYFNGTAIQTPANLPYMYSLDWWFVQDGLNLPTASIRASFGNVGASSRTPITGLWPDVYEYWAERATPGRMVYAWVRIRDFRGAETLLRAIHNLKTRWGNVRVLIVSLDDWSPKTQMARAVMLPL